MTGRFEIKKSSNGQFFFNLKAANGEVILTSEQYNAKSEAEQAIKSVKTSAPIGSRYLRKKSSVGQYYAVLRAANGALLGRSEMHSSVSSMENGIALVKANAPDAGVYDLT